MADERTTIRDLREVWAKFVRDREWDQFHNPKNLCMALSVEASELMEHFLWVDNEQSQGVLADPEKREAVADEIADVTGVVLALCNALGFDLSDIVAQKMQKNVLKYPVEKCRGHYENRD